MDINKIKTAIDNIDENYLLDAAELISGKDTDMKKEKNVNINADDMIVVENHKSKPMGKVTKWLSVAAVFCFIVAGITLIGITSGNNQVSTSEVTPLESNAPVTESQDSILSVPARPNVDDPITSKDEHRVDEWEKAMNEVSALHLASFDLECKIEGQQVVENDNIRYIDYKGGEITLKSDISISFRNKDKIPEKVSVGYYVVINGVVQDLYVDGKSIGKTYIHNFGDGKIETMSVSDDFSFSFTPKISAEDKDKKEFNIMLVEIRNPHFRVSPFYIASATSHGNITKFGWKLRTDNASIENVVEESDGRFVNYEKTVNDNPDRDHGAKITNADGSPYEIRCNGNSVSLQTTLRTDESDKNKKYRILYLVNGIPVTLADGTPYIEIDVEPLSEYTFDTVTIDGVKPYDTVSVIEFICDEDNRDLLHPSAIFPTTVVPEDYVRKVG